MFALSAIASASKRACVKGVTGPGDTTPPTLVSAIVSNSTPGRIDLTWSEAMNSAVSASSAFAVSAGHTLTAHTWVDGTHSYLTTSTDFANGEAARTLAYTQPGSNKMQDVVGNLLANFSGTSITNNVGGNSVTADFSMSRSASGTAPYLLAFDATGVTTNVTQASDIANGGVFRQIYYEWDFDDAAAGNWLALGMPKTAFDGGAIAGYVFDSGTKVHAVTLRVTVGNKWMTHTSSKPVNYAAGTIVFADPAGGTSYNTYLCATTHTPGTFSTDLAASKWTLIQTGLIQDTVTKNVTITAADTTYSGTNTIYVSPSANYGSAPSGATTRTTLPSLASNRRVMLRGGETYGDINISGLTNCQVVWDGTGARPVCGRLNISGTGNVFKGLNPQLGISGFTGSHNLAYLNKVEHSDANATTLYWSNDGFNDHYSQCVYPGFVSNDVPKNDDSIASMYGGARGHIMLDNDVGGAGQHTFRALVSRTYVTAFNKLHGGTFNSSKLTHKQHALGLVQWPTTSATGVYATEYGVEAYNEWGSSDSTQSWIADVAPQNLDSTTVEGISDIIVKNNVFVRGGSTSTDFLYCGRRITMRGNSVASGALNISNIKDASGAGGVVGSTNATYRSQWVDNGFLA